jgi:glycosyltransferase involved in cell wall biosynthesis
MSSREVVVAVRAHVPAPRPQGFQALQQAVGLAELGVVTTFLAHPARGLEAPAALQTWLGRTLPPKLTVRVPERDLGATVRGLQLRASLLALRSRERVLLCRDPKIAAAEVGRWAFVAHEWHEAPRPDDAAHRETLGRVDLHVPVAPGLRELLRAAGVPAERVLLLPNASSLRRERAARRRDGWTSGQGPVLVLGLHRRPGARDVLAAWDQDARLPDLLVAGEREGTDLPRWLGARPGDPRIRFTGPAWGQAREDLLDCAALWLCPYPRDTETEGALCPLQVCDALASGLPVVAPDLPSVHALEGPGALAHTYEPGDARDLARAVRDALTAGPGFAAPARPRWVDRAARLRERWEGAP